MNQEAFAVMVEVALLALAVVGFVSILAAGVYDILAITRRSRLRADMRKLRKPRQPTVTVIIYAQNDSDTITECLQSVRRSSYRNYDIIVVDNVSRDSTRRAVRGFMKKYPGLPLRLYAKRKPVSVEMALEQAYRRSQKGEFIVTLSGASRPSRDLIKAATARLIDDTASMGIAMNERSLPSPTIATALPVLVRLSRHILAKGLSLIGLNRGCLGLSAIYRHSAYGAGKAKIRYEGTLVLPVAKVAPNGQLSDNKNPGSLLGKLMVGVVMLLLMMYSMAMAAFLISSTPLIMGWLLVVVWSVVVIWSDEGGGMVQKIEQTMTIPFVYFLAYAMLAEFVLKTGVKRLTYFRKVGQLYPLMRLRRRAIS